MAENPSSPLPLTADEWLDGLSDDDRRLWLGLTADAREAGRSRVDAVLRFLRKEVTASQAIRATGLRISRFYELARTWPKDRRIETLGLYANAPLKRASSIAKSKLAARGRAIEEMRRLLVEQPTIGTEAALRHVLAVVGEDLARKSLLRWWLAERRRVSHWRLLGRDVAWDACDLDLWTPAGAPYKAAFFVDVGASLVLGAAVVDPGHVSSGYQLAALDAIDRMRSLDFGRLRGAASLRSISVSLLRDDNTAEAIRFLGVLPPDGVLPVYDTETHGRLVMRVVGGRLGRIRFAQPSTVVCEEGAKRNLELKDARAMLRHEMDGYMAATALMLDQAAPAPDGPAAASRLLDLLTETTSKLS